MATATETLKMILSADDRASSVFGKFGASIITVNQGLQLLQSVGRGLSAVLGTTTNFLLDVGRAADAAALAHSKLETTLRSTNQFTPEYAQELKNIASELQDLTGQSDETVLSISRQLIAFGASRDQIRRLTVATFDLAAGMGEGEGGAAAAALLLGKAVAGEFSTLSRYGIMVDQNATNTEKLNQALLQIEQRFGGQAQARMKTFGGQVSLLGENYGDLKEVIGEAIFNSDAFFSLFEEGNKIIKEAQEFIRQNREEIQRWAQQGLLLGVESADALNSVLREVSAGIVDLTRRFVAASPALQASFALLIRDPQLIVQSFRAMREHDFSDVLKSHAELTQDIRKGFETTGDAIARIRGRVQEALGQPTREAAVDIDGLNKRLAETDALIRRINAQGGLKIGAANLEGQLARQKLTTNSPN